MYRPDLYNSTRFSYGIWNSFFASLKLSSLHNVCKFNLKINYPPPYEREVWNYQKTNVDQIRQAICEFPWDNRFANISVNEQVQLFTQTFQNIISNYIPHETITCDDRDAPWIDEKIQKLVLHKNRAFNAYSRDKNNTDLFNKLNLFKHI